MEKKICSKCKIEKEVCEFNKKSVSKNGMQYYKSRCKKCQSEDEKIKRDSNPQQYKIWYDKTRVDRNKWRSEYYQSNKEKNSEKFRLLSNEYYKKNKDKRLEYRKSYLKNNREKYNEYVKNKKLSSPIYHLSFVVRNRIRTFLKSKNITKNNSTFNIVGCAPIFLKEHLEKQFTDGMSWENHGLYGWHIDHIIPLSSAKTEEEIYELCHYTNLQPLWAEDNLKKGVKIKS